VELDIDVLDSKLSSLDDGSQHRLAQTQSCPHQEETHRQNPQQRCLARILQPDHGDVHLGRPAQGGQLAVVLRHACTLLCFFYGMGGDIKWHIRQAPGPAHGKDEEDSR
jgi:hypothetical protein